MAVYEVLNARVKQKINTESEWIAEEDAFGVIFEGEQAFVKTEEGLPVNFKIGDGTKKFSELPYFIAYYNNVTNCKVLSYINGNSNITIATTFRNQSDIYSLVFINNSGAPVNIRIGTTDGGSEIAGITLPNGATQVGVKYFFTSPQDVYITGLTGVDYSLFLLYYQLDEAPVIPTSGGGGSAGITTRYAYGTIYEFIPMYVGHTAAAWDLATGLGKGEYAGAKLFGTAYSMPNLGGKYLIGANPGDTIGGATGSITNTITIAKTNLPPIQLTLGKDQKGGSSGAQVLSALTPGPFGVNNYELGGDSTAISIKPNSMIVLRYTGLPTT